MNKENMKKEILEQQKQVVSENFVGIDYDAVFPRTTAKYTIVETGNFVGIDYDAVFPRTTAKSLMVENEKLCYFGDFGVYVKGEW